jgi:chloramphenicol O-acetyltransferase
MLQHIFQFANNVQIPEHIRKKLIQNELFDPNLNPLPDIESSYSKDLEDLDNLIETISNQMKDSPNNNIISSIKEKVNLKGIKRDIEIKGQIPEKYNENIEQFKDDILSTITSTKSFFALDDKKTWQIENTFGNGNKFECPEVFDINGDESIIDLNGNDGILFIYENPEDFDYLQKNINKINIYCICNTDDFFERRKYLINNGLLNQFPHFFIEPDSNSFKGLKLPRMIIINDNGVVYENKPITHEKISKFENKLLYENNDNNEKIIIGFLLLIIKVKLILLGLLINN